MVTERDRHRADRVRAIAAGCAAVALGACLAFWNLGFGLPLAYRPDEDVMVGRAVWMAMTWSPDPLFYNYPPLVFYLFAAAERIQSLFPGHSLGATPDVPPASEYLAARAVSAASQTLTVLLVFVAARRWRAPAGAALAGAVAVAAAPLAVRQAHFATSDAAAVLLVAATIAVASGPPARRRLVAAGALAGAAAAAKYTSGAVLLVPLTLAVTARMGRRSVAALAGAALLAFLVLVLPAGHPVELAQGIAFLGRRASGAYLDLPPGIVYHPLHSIPFGFGLGAAAMTLVSVVAAARRRLPEHWALLAFGAVYLATIGSSREVFFRYTLPLLPAAGLLIAVGLRDVRAARFGRWAAPAAAVLILVPSLYTSVATDRLLGTTSTQQLAAAWLLQNATAGSEVRVASYWAQPLYDDASFEDRPLHPLYLTGRRVPDSFELGLYARGLSINRPGAPCFQVVASEPLSQYPPPRSERVRAIFAPASSAAGVEYDTLDSFWVPFWGFEAVHRPGPALAIAGC